jgi:hypothetical protein
MRIQDPSGDRRVYDLLTSVFMEEPIGRFNPSISG